MEINKADTREYYLDYLRILAVAAVIIVHVSSSLAIKLDIYQADWISVTIYNSLFRIGLYLFVMISGALMLTREIAISQVIRKIPRLIIAFIVWDVIYLLVNANHDGSPVGILSTLIEGPIHMWFIPMFIALYLLIPVFKQIMKDMKIWNYFMIFMFAVVLLLPGVERVIGVVSGGLKSAFSTLYGYFDVGMAGMYPLLFMAGAYIKTTDLKPVYKKLVYVFGVLGAVIITVGTIVYSRHIGERSAVFIVSGIIKIPFVFGIFILFKDHISRAPKSELGRKTVKALSNLSFGAMLSHLLAAKYISEWTGFSTSSFNPVFAIPLFALAVLVVSFAISWILNKIPVINKYVC